MPLRQMEFIKALAVLYTWRDAYTTLDPIPNITNMVLILNCLRNRVSHGWGDWLSVLAHMPAFSARKRDETQLLDKFPDCNEPHFLRFLAEIDNIFDGVGVDPSNGSHFYCDTNSIDNSWFLTNICQRPTEHPRVGGNNSFVTFR